MPFNPIDRLVRAAASGGPEARSAAVALHAYRLGLIAAGSLVWAAAINAILVPSDFVAGGFTGLAIVIHYGFPALPLGAVFAALNVPVFVLAYRSIGKRFFFYSLAGMAMLTAWLEVVHPPVLLAEAPVPAAVAGGILAGLGAGMILRSRGSCGGTDVIAVTAARGWSIPPGAVYLSFDSGVMALATLVIPLERVIYTLIFIFVMSRVVNLVVWGLQRGKSVVIVTRQWRQMAEELLARTTGATVLDAAGAYTGRQEKMVYTVVNLRELGAVKSLVARHDPSAFMVITEALDVRGQRFQTQPDW
jgi:uncharacterized membrane-anchored protein YitT (DUF2179 family)